MHACSICRFLAVFLSTQLTSNRNFVFFQGCSSVGASQVLASGALHCVLDVSSHSVTPVEISISSHLKSTPTSNLKSQSRSRAQIAGLRTCRRPSSLSSSAARSTTSTTLWSVVPHFVLVQISVGACRFGGQADFSLQCLDSRWLNFVPIALLFIGLYPVSSLLVLCLISTSDPSSVLPFVEL